MPLSTQEELDWPARVDYIEITAIKSPDLKDVLMKTMHNLVIFTIGYVLHYVESIVTKHMSC